MRPLSDDAIMRLVIIVLGALGILLLASIECSNAPGVEHAATRIP